MRIFSFVVMAFAGARINGLDLDKVHDLIDSTGDIVLTGGYDPYKKKTLVYAIDRVRYDALPPSSHEYTMDNIKLSPADAVRSAEKELSALHPELEGCSVGVASVALIPWELSGQRNDHIWVYLVDLKAGKFHNKDNGQTLSGERRIFRFFVLLDGEVLPPRVTAYSRYIDQARPSAQIEIWLKTWWGGLVIGCVASGVMFLLAQILLRHNGGLKRKVSPQLIFVRGESAKGSDPIGGVGLVE